MPKVTSVCRLAGRKCKIGCLSAPNFCYTMHGIKLHTLDVVGCSSRYAGDISWIMKHKATLQWGNRNLPGLQEAAEEDDADVVQAERPSSLLPRPSRQWAPSPHARRGDVGGVAMVGIDPLPSNDQGHDDALGRKHVKVCVRPPEGNTNVAEKPVSSS